MTNYARVIAIWATGIVAAGAIGAGIGSKMGPYGGGDFLGMIAGPCVFACVRLWLSGLRSSR